MSICALTKPHDYNENNPDREMLISQAAFTRMLKESKTQGIGLSKLMRIKASQLVRTGNPRFDVTGDALDRVIKLGINNSTYTKLVLFCGKRGIPPAALGEVLASFVAE